MHVTNFVINDFGPFKDFNINLSEKENIIVGSNGSGKSLFINLLRYVIMSENDKINNFSKKTKESYIKLELKFDKEQIYLSLQINFIGNQTLMLMKIQSI